MMPSATLALTEAVTQMHFAFDPNGRIAPEGRKGRLIRRTRRANPLLLLPCRSREEFCRSPD
jgi:hypothetical protein